MSGINYSMDHPQQRAFILANFQEYRTIQPTVVFLHGLPTALSQKEVLRLELGRVGPVVRVSTQSVGKDFFTAFAEYGSEVEAAMAIVAFDHNWVMNRQVRVFYGSTKFCPHYLKGNHCRLADCNYAHYFHPSLTHLKDQAKEIDHHAIAHMFLTQGLYFTQQVVLSLLQGPTAEGFILPLRLDKLSKDYCGIELSPCQSPQNPSPEPPSLPPQEQWGTISTQIETNLKDAPSPPEAPRSPIQEFLDGAERFLTKLIFQSSMFVY